MGDEPMRRRSMLERLIPAMRLDLALYREVCADRLAGGQAFLVVLLSGISNGLALSGPLGNLGMTAGVAAALLGWVLWAFVIRVVARIGGHHRDRRSLLRALGFADAPGILLALGGVPRVGSLLRSLIVVWLLATTARAIEAVYDVPRRRATVITLIVFVIYLVIGAISGYFAAGA